MTRRQDFSQLLSMNWARVLLRAVLRLSPIAPQPQKPCRCPLSVALQIAGSRLSSANLGRQVQAQTTPCSQLPQQLLQQLPHQALQAHKHHVKRGLPGGGGDGGPPGTQRPRQATAAQARAVPHSPGGGWTPGSQLQQSCSSKGQCQAPRLFLFTESSRGDMSWHQLPSLLSMKLINLAQHLTWVVHGMPAVQVPVI